VYIETLPLQQVIWHQIMISQHLIKEGVKWKVCVSSRHYAGSFMEGMRMLRQMTKRSVSVQQRGQSASNKEASQRATKRSSQRATKRSVSEQQRGQSACNKEVSQRVTKRPVSEQQRGQSACNKQVSQRATKRSVSVQTVIWSWENKTTVTHCYQNCHDLPYLLLAQND
jgi:hypothetical protein